MPTPVNRVYRNAILSSLVSSKSSVSQSFIAKTLGASRHYVRKALVRWVHVETTRENLWGVC